MKTFIIFIWGSIIILISALFFCFGKNTFFLFPYFIISLISGSFLMMLCRKIPIFSPIFMLFSSIFINIGLPAVLFISTNSKFSDDLLFKVSIIYLIYFIFLIIPVLLINKIPFYEIKNNFLTGSFNNLNINFYLLTSSLIIILLIFLILKLTGYSYIKAFLNPTEFRYFSSAGSVAYLRKILFFLLIFNTFFLSRYNFCENKYKFENNWKLLFFSVLHFFMVFGFGVISGSRSAFLLPCFSTLIIYCFYNFLDIKKTVFFLILVVITLIFVSFYSVYRANPNILNKNNSFYVILQKTNPKGEVLKRLDSFKNSVSFFDYIERENNTILFFKEFHFIEQIKNQILQPFPRNLFPQKGQYFSTEMTMRIFSPNSGKLRVTYNFGAISNAFWNLGLTGVMIEAFILGFIVVFLQKGFKFFLKYDAFFLIYMTTIFYIPNSILVDGFWNTMDTGNFLLNMFIVAVIILFLKIKVRIKI